jgi:hypothetical protein
MIKARIGPRESIDGMYWRLNAGRGRRGANGGNACSSARARFSPRGSSVTRHGVREARTIVMGPATNGIGLRARSARRHMNMLVT